MSLYSVSILYLKHARTYFGHQHNGSSPFGFFISSFLVNIYSIITFELTTVLLQSINDFFYIDIVYFILCDIKLTTYTYLYIPFVKKLKKGAAVFTWLWQTTWSQLFINQIYIKINLVFILTHLVHTHNRTRHQQRIKNKNYQEKRFDSWYQLCVFILFPRSRLFCCQQLCW